MGRGIPDVVPNEIDEILYSRWGDMKSFSVSVGLPYTSVYSILCRSTHRMIDSLIAMADACPVATTPDELATILLIPNMIMRRKELELRTKGMSQNAWAKKAGLNAPTVSRMINNLEQSQLSDLMIVVEALGVDLKQFRGAYKCSPQRSA